MAQVRFLKDYDYKPKPAVTIGYKEGQELTVRRECADDAIALGRAVEIKPKRKRAAKTSEKASAPTPPAEEPTVSDAEE